MTTEPIQEPPTPEQLVKMQVAMERLMARDIPANEANTIPVADRAALCCAVDHPLSWTAASGEQFTITKPEVQDGAVFLWVIAARDGADFYHDDHYFYGMTDLVVDTSNSIPVLSRDWVIALQKNIESVVLR